ncbi:hypothetical protein RvY_02752-1 [Ramazzottius varieornatus]|uniref:Uncharacterized protein n=1 Tax=Ramazzottius varieornatus TaxID=947166 RepID=A0A1D1ULK6_RAMVA|nr:hypothetical protein RvY_02752-1 [Ramazzottius varieornatus]
MPSRDSYCVISRLLLEAISRFQQTTVNLRKAVTAELENETVCNGFHSSRKTRRIDLPETKAVHYGWKLIHGYPQCGVRLSVLCKMFGFARDSTARGVDAGPNCRRGRSLCAASPRGGGSELRSRGRHERDIGGGSLNAESRHEVQPFLFWNQPLH